MRNKKTVCLSAITLLNILMVISCIIIICFCDWPILKPFKTWTFLLQSDKDKTLYNIAISYVAAYIFYILQVYIPEKNKEESLIPLRAAMQREIQFFIIWIVELWMLYYKHAVEKGKLNKSITKSIDYVFDENNMYEVLKFINLSDLSPRQTVHGSNYTWKCYTKETLTKIINWGNKIIANWAAELPPEIYYAVFYMTQESKVVFLMQQMLSFPEGLIDLTTLADTILVDPKTQKVNLSMDAASIKTLVEWVNEEYSFLSNQKKYTIPSIREINIVSRAEW